MSGEQCAFWLSVLQGARERQLSQKLRWLGIPLRRLRVTATDYLPCLPACLPAGVAVVVGDVYQSETIDAAMAPGFDAVIVVVGADPLKPSSVVTDSARAIVAAARKAGIPRYLGITGTAEMPNKSILGKISTAILRRTPVGHAARDHDGAFAI